MARAKREFQASLLVDLGGGSPFRAATLRSALVLRQSCARAGISLELLVHVDPDDGLCRNLLMAESVNGWLEEDPREFQSPGAVPAEWIARAKGEYITVLQAPDLVTPNWVPEALRMIGQAKAVAHPEAVLFPDLDRCRALVLKSSNDEHPTPRSAFAANPYGVLFLAHRDVLLDLPLGSATFKGECPVWKWNCDALAGGIRHVVVPETFHVMRTEERVNQAGFLGASDLCIPGPSPWFSRPDRSDLPAPEEGELALSLESGTNELGEYAPDLKRLFSRRWGQLVLPRVAVESAHVFFGCMIEFPKRPEYLVVHHVLSVGGSEKETLINLAAIRSLRPGLRLGLITTENRHSEWVDRVPPGTCIAELGISGRYLGHRELKTVLFRLLLQLSPKVINNVISPLCWEVFVERAGVLARRSSLLATEFCVNRNEKGDPECFAYSHLPECWEHVELLLSDNRHLLDHLSKQFGFDRNQVLKFPPQMQLKKPVLGADRGRAMRVLWAGRFNRQKRPDVLLQVARTCPEHEFHVFCTSPDDLKTRSVLEDLRNLPNAFVRGPYTRFDEIAGETFDALLYTSSWDGLPNIILEAIAAGIPVIAPAVGGIPEVLHESTGYLVSDPDAVGEFAAHLQSVLLAPKEALAKARFAQIELATERNGSSLKSTWSNILDSLLGAREASVHELAPPI